MDKEYVKIDEKSFEDHLVFASRLSKFFSFYGDDNKIQGDWSHFFSDDVVVLSSIIDVDPAKIERRFKSYINKIALFKRSEKKKKYLLRCFLEVYTIAKDFDNWYLRFKEVEHFSQVQLTVRVEIDSAISTKLAPALRKFKTLYGHSFDKPTKKVNPEIDFDAFSPIWGLTQGDTASYKGKAKEGEEEELLRTIQNVFQSFYETLLYLKTKTPGYLQHAMESDTHFPEVALYLAFLKLYTYTQDNINDLTGKHLDFYYKEILTQVSSGSQVDKIYLQMVLDQGARTTKVPAQTKFIGVDARFNDDVVYRSVEDLLVSQAKIKKIYAVFVDQTMLTLGEKQIRKIDNILFSELSMSALTTDLGGQDHAGHTSVALFGEDQGGKGHLEKTMEDAKVGFAFSSPNLYLKGGFRDIEISIQLNDEAYDQLIVQLTALGKAVKDEINEFFIKAFTASFVISLSTAEGWMSIDQYIVKRDDKKKTVSFTFDLTNTDPAVIGYDPNIHGGGYSSELPIVQFILNSQTFIYPYTLLSLLEIEQVWFHVKVKKLKHLQLHNNIGQLSPDAPFFPFGPSPKSGAYFVVGSNEAFSKTLDDIKLNVEWFDLPLHKEGFKEHYKGYGKDLNNSSFEVKLSILDGGYWKPQDKGAQQKLKLFRTVNGGTEHEPMPNGELSELSVFSNIDAKKVNQSPDYGEITNTDQLSSLSTRGYLKLELSSPIHGFGHGVYPAVLSETIMENAKRGLFKTKSASKQKEAPNQPYTPQIKTISLDYTSSAAISLVERGQKKAESTGQIFHIHPFGLQQVHPEEMHRKTFLLPHYDYEGAAYFGFADLSPSETVTILFELIDEYTESSEEGLPDIQWSYLVKDQWLPLAASRIVKDETNHFLKTGVIQIALPDGLEKNNTILDPNLYWLRAAVVKNINTVSSLISVATNVTQAVLSNLDSVSEDYLKEPLPKGTVKRLVNHIPGIKEVKQSLASFDGVSAEQSDQFHTRVAERLRHKSRAVTSWDYERMILEKFPEIAHVTCLANMTSKSTHAPGNALMVVIPRQSDSANRNEPMVSSEVLINIKSYLKNYASPFVKNEIRNPNYERIKIICAVKFNEGSNHGYYIQKLNEQINHYLRGTLLSHAKKIELGGSLNSSDLLSFIRTLPYVNLITGFSMIQVSRDVNGEYQLVDTAREGAGDIGGSLHATKPWSVLVPAPEHQISVIKHEGMDAQDSRQAGIDLLELGHDFVIEE
ncbi:baseplate J/gp47 family protein [Reichenbachiella carrageenanivorans]|uniref:Baseplate J/gp47 family protein n=1 Tax=Reichenbachiella carrageenanivorans TaxID=2979869 RepID=A0ABY6CUZ3_9BACT|nr:baseplate J/gp47 family protein [Reichenbachiella carrageenanivorans]UXX77737.1 baseplate J/gp47 family protein [Reichenbachiella carrageenanivorans]